MLFVPTTSHAQVEPGFEMNFAPHTSAGLEVSSIIEWAGYDQPGFVGYLGSSGPVQTPFLTMRQDYDPTGQHWQSPEIVKIAVDDGSGNMVDRYFYHMVIGDMEDGFVQESYIETNYSMLRGGSFLAPGGDPNTIAGMPTYGYYASASGGDYDVTYTSPAVLPGSSNNADPLGPSSTSGSGTGNPERMIMAQYVNDGELFLEFRKDKLLYKPRIYQSVDIFDHIEVMFEIDMSKIKYDDNTTEAKITNTLKLFGDNIPLAYGITNAPDGGNFDRVKDAKDDYVTAGKFIWNEGNDVLESPGGANGSYTYIDGNYDPTVEDWEGYFDAGHKSGNPWSFESGKP